MPYDFILTPRSKHLWISCSESSCPEHKRLSSGSQKNLESAEKVQLQQAQLTFLSIRKQINSPKALLRSKPLLEGLTSLATVGQSFQRTPVLAKTVPAWKPREMRLEEGGAGVGWGRQKWVFFRIWTHRLEQKSLRGATITFLPALKLHHFPRQGRSSSEQLQCISRCRISWNTSWS